MRFLFRHLLATVLGVLSLVFATVGMRLRTPETCILYVQYSAHIPLAWPSCEGTCDQPTCQLADPYTQGDITAWYCKCGNGLPNSECRGVLLVNNGEDPPTYEIQCIPILCGPGCTSNYDNIFDPPGTLDTACDC